MGDNGTKQKYDSIGTLEELSCDRELGNEAEATTWFLNWARNNILDFYAYKIPDAGVALKPFDILCFNGTSKGAEGYVMEVKYIRQKKVEKEDLRERMIKMLEPHQRSNLNRLRAIGVHCFLVGYVREHKKFYLVKFE